jgi:hypothetical protein
MLTIEQRTIVNINLNIFMKILEINRDGTYLKKKWMLLFNLECQLLQWNKRVTILL